MGQSMGKIEMKALTGHVVGSGMGGQVKLLGNLGSVGGNVRRRADRLSALAVKRVSSPGMHPDGLGLYLLVGKSGSKSWIYRYRQGGRLRDMGLGPLHTVSLAEAREEALACRKLRREGRDPIEARKAKRAQAQLEAAKAMTFRQCAEAYIAAHEAGWRNPKHAAQWPSTLEANVYPVFGKLSVQSVDVGLVMKAIEPIWTVKPETAGRVRGRIESILDWAATRGYRQGENPARWRGHLENLLPKKTKVRAVEHHAALPFAEIGAFIDLLRKQEGNAARALEFVILTAARTGEVIGATWSEIDLAGRLWTVPAQRMKSGREHRVPLNAAAIAILEGMRMQGAPASGTSFVFAGLRAGQPLSNMAMPMLLRRMGRGEITVHGFRSTFRDWAADLTDFPGELAELALAHAVGDKVEAAYRRGDGLRKRYELMKAWSEFSGTPAARAGG
jgi:integrase